MKVLSRHRFDAIVLDLDGVITDTANLHALAWKATFDAYLDSLPEAQQPFQGADYRHYVDGKPRLDGIRSFLHSRGLNMPEGEPLDDPGRDTVFGLGNRKNQLFRRILRTDGVRVFPASLAFMQSAHEAGFALAVASSSRNGRAVLEAARIGALFEAVVDGTDLARRGLRGKPEPDMFAEASRRLNSSPARTIGVEDAEVGIRAIKTAGFGCAIGVGDPRRHTSLRREGADLVVKDLSELQVEH